MSLLVRCLILVLLSSAPVAAETIFGAARVVDGDTLAIGDERIRLFGIDAPEHDQSCDRGGQSWACGQAAARVLAAVVGQIRLVCEVQDRDRYGRAVSVCHAGQTDVGEAMVVQGAATAYRRYSMRYVVAETEARAKGRGIWGGAMQSPEAFRHKGGVAGAAGGSAAVRGCAIKGNIGTHGRIYHMPGQADYAATRISPAQGERWFCSQAEARAAGFRKAKR